MNISYDIRGFPHIQNDLDNNKKKIFTSNIYIRQAQRKCGLYLLNTYQFKTPSGLSVVNN